MANLGLLLRASVLLRSLAVQGSWNYRSMLGAGMAFALLPVLAKIYRGDPESLARAIARHSGFFNSHPYLATLAVGTLARMESEGASGEEIERLRSALVSPLGTLGDRLIWARWRPFCAMVAVLLLVSGSPWWIACGLFLLLYNLVHLGLRVWGLDVGWSEGRQVGSSLRGSTLRRLPDRITIPLTTVSGAVLPPLVVTVGEAVDVGPWFILLFSGTLVALGFWRPAIMGRLAALILVLGTVAFAGLMKLAW